MTDESRDVGFTDFLEFKAANAPAKPRMSNVVKATEVRFERNHRVEIPDVEANQPSVILHHVGDTVQNIEFSCKCGRSAIVRVEYEEE
jgi:hypothetical protein